MNIKVGLSQGLSQGLELNLAPQLLQWLNLLQVPCYKLESVVRQELEVNPALELAEEDVLQESDGLDEVDPGLDSLGEDGDILTEDWDKNMDILRDMGDDWVSEGSGTAGDRVLEQERYDHRMASVSECPTLRSAVMRQLAEMGVPDKLRSAAMLIAGTLDARGYLPVSLEALSMEASLPLSDLTDALGMVQCCEPRGIGARDLQECLLLQLPPEDSAHEVARCIVTDHLEVLAQRREEAIARYLSIDLSEVRLAADLISRLNPHPGIAFENAVEAQTVTPDVIIRADGEGGFEIEVVEWSMPRLRVSRACRELIRRGGLSADEVAYVRSRIRAAMFLIDGLQKRLSTLRRIAEQIVRVQYRFLQGDEDGIRPLTMAKVAGLIGVHDTTVSRALAEKYVETPHGMYPMKQFFQSGYRCDDGSSVTPDMVRKRIEGFILMEDPCCPIKDETIAQRLRLEGVPVARRTVAKYRGELGLPSSKERAVENRCRPLAVEACPPAAAALAGVSG